MKFHTLSLSDNSNPDLCVLEDIIAGEEDRVTPAWGLRWNKPLAPAFTYSMASFHNGIKPADLVCNVINLIVLSDAGRAIFEAHAHAEIEYLPATIQDHRKRLLKRPFWTANVIGCSDCVDRSKTEGEKTSNFGRNLPTANTPTWESPERPNDSEYHHLFRLVLDQARIPTDRDIFRIKSIRMFVISERFRQALLAAGLSGLSTIPVGEKPGCTLG